MYDLGYALQSDLMIMAAVIGQSNAAVLLALELNTMLLLAPAAVPFHMQAFHDKGKDGVRVLMYEEMAKRLQCPLHIHIGYDDGTSSNQADVYGGDMPGEPIRLIREPTDLYRK
jgi:hypothetical protein